MSICFLSYVELPESPNSAAHQRIEFLSKRHRVTMVTPRWAHVPPAVAAVADVRRVSAPRPRFLGDIGWAVGIALFSLAVVREVFRLRRDGLDLIYTFHTPESCIAWALRLVGIRWVVDVLDLPHLNAADETYLGARRLHLARVRTWLLGFMKRAFRRADLVITIATSPDEGCAKVLRDDFKVPATKMLLVPNGVDLDLVVPGDRDPGDGATFQVVYVGFVSPRRGVDTLVRACDIAGRTVPGLTLVLAGPAKDEDLRALDDCSAAAKHAVVTYLGPQEHEKVLALMRSADVCVYPFPRTIELDGVMPIKVIEYLASGRAVVATRLTGITGIITDGDNGLLVEPGDPEEMARAIACLAEDASMRARLEGAARRSVAGFAWAAILAQIEGAMMAAVA